MKPHIFKNLFRTLCGILLVQLGCTREAREVVTPAPTAGEEVTITVNIPGNQTPATRSMAEWGGEAAVERVDILIFEAGATSGDPEVLAEHVVGKNITQSSASSDRYQVQFQAELTENPQAQTIVILANVPQATVQAAAAAGAEKQIVLSELQYASSNTTGSAEGWKWKSNEAGSNNPVAGTDYDLIPMYGEQALGSGITSGMKIQDIDLVRMLARIDLVNSAAGDFTLSEIYLVNYNTAGYIAPAWNTANGVLLPALPKEPMIPAGANAQLGAANALKYSYADNGGEGLAGVIYTYEAVRASGAESSSSRIQAPCLILRGTYAADGREYYYRIDFTDSVDANGKQPGDAGFDPSSIDYYPLYRNHRYLFDITTVEGIGYSSFEQALQSMGVMNNLQVTLHVIDEAGIQSVIWNGQHYLGVGSLTGLDPAGGTFPVKVITNYYDGWEIDTDQGMNGIVYEGAQTGWLSALTSASETLTVTVEANPDEENSRSAWIYVKAARLRHKIQVEQLSNTSTVPIGGEANCYILEPGQELLIPVARANEGWPGSIADGDMIVGELLWTDNSKGLDASSNIETVYSEGTGPEGFIYVKTGTAEGNAVVCVKVNGEIQWSWHIWVTQEASVIQAGHSGNTEWMDRNLGAFSNQFSAWDDPSVYGTFYQRGRKDPFPPNDLYNRYDASGNQIAWVEVPSVYTVENTIRLPMEWTNNSYGTYYGSNGDKSWNDSGKTVWDPCPAGWKVPPASMYSGVTVANF
ncbi:MAG: hypothetical protein LUD68_04180, partial [Rikenellaceae bacterium]|nr:hypothetical protein [Rikenellaceae bacterium]